jgi:hypothetical protein
MPKYRHNLNKPADVLPVKSVSIMKRIHEASKPVTLVSHEWQNINNNPVPSN